MTDRPEIKVVSFETRQTFYYDTDEKTKKKTKKIVSYLSPTRKRIEDKKNHYFFHLLYLVFLQPFDPLRFLRKSKKNIPDAIRNINRDTNWWRLEFLRDKRWLAALGAFCTKIRALTSINQALARTNVVFAYLAWAYYLPRLFVNMIEITCITIFCVHWDEKIAEKIKTQSWRERLSDIWSARWFEIVNDVAWIIVGLINCFIFFTNPVLSMYITVALYKFDVFNALLKAGIDYKNQKVKLKNANENIKQSAEGRKNLTNQLNQLENNKTHNTNDTEITKLKSEILNFEYTIAENQATIDTVYHDRKKWALYTAVTVCLLLGMICMCSFCPPTVVLIGTSFILATIFTQWFAYRYLDVIKPPTSEKIRNCTQKNFSTTTENGGPINSEADNNSTSRNSSSVLMEQALKNNNRAFSGGNLPANGNNRETDDESSLLRREQSNTENFLPSFLQIPIRKKM